MARVWNGRAWVDVEDEQGTLPTAAPSKVDVPAFQGDAPNNAPYDPSQFKSPGIGENPGTHAAPTGNPFTGQDLVEQETEAQTSDLLVDPATGRRFDPATGQWEDPPKQESPLEKVARNLSTIEGTFRSVASPSALQGTRTATSGSRTLPAGSQLKIEGMAPTAIKGTSLTPSSGPPVVDRGRIDSILSDINEIGGYLKSLGLNDDRFSAAAAQLQIGLSQAQNQALALARSGNRRDRAALERQAINQQAELGSQATQSAALLRAEEEKNQKQIALDAFTRAGELGLNAGALDLNAQNVDITAATNYLNQLFETERLGLQLDQQEAERVTNFIRDMSLIAKDYYALNLQERQSIRDDLTRRYGISQEVAAKMAELDAKPGFWEQATLGVISAAGTGFTGALAKKVIG